MNLFVSIILTLQFVFYDTLGKLCETESCKRMAGDLNKMIDKTIDPCDDFSYHLCGNMDKAFSIPPGGTDFDATTEINEAVTATMKNLLINQPLKNHSLPQTKAAILYKSCLDMNSRNQYTKPTILKLLKLFKSENSYEDNLIHLLNSGMGSRMISFDVQQNPTNPKYNILNIGKPSLILSEETLQADKSNTSKELMASYSKFINKILDILGLWKNNRTIIDEIIKLHIRLAKAFPSIADQNDPDKISNKLTIKELQQRCSQISWLKIINGALKGSGKYLNETDTVMIFSLEYIDTVCKVIEEYKTNPSKKSILDKDLEWMVISHAAPLGSEQLIEANDMFQQNTIGKVCDTQVCKKMAAELKVMIDSKISPCEDFSSYICGNLDKLHSIPPGGTSYDASVEVDTDVTNELKQLLEKQSVTNQSQPQAKAAIFYKSCLNITERNRETKSAVLNFLKRLSNENNFQDNLVFLMKSGMGIRLFSLDVSQDPTNPQYYMFSIGKPSLILLEGTLQNFQSETSKQQIQSYTKFMNKVLDILGIWQNNKTIINEIVKLHVRLSKSFPSIADQNDPDKSTNKLSIKELQSICPEISWLKFVNGIMKNTGKQFKDSEKLVIFSIEYIKSLCQVLKEYTNDPIKRNILEMDLAWAAIIHTVPLGSEAFIEANEQFKSETLGIAGKKDSWKKCVKITSNTLTEIMGNMYVKAKFAPSQKKDIEFMIGNIKAALKDVIEKVTWMDTKTKDLALVKLSSITHKIGYPDSLLSETNLTKTYSRVNMAFGKFMENYINFQEFAHDEMMKIVGDKIDEDTWSMGSQEVNAYYNPSSNEIVFPAAILRYPYYDIGLPITYNYGGIGMVMGHEILHGFDTSGSKFDAKGLLREWWSKSSRDEYLRKTNCIVEQYGNYSIYNESLPSDQTVGEDIADNAGLRMSYFAVNSVGEKREKLTLPGLDFTPDQLFFIGEARAWCSIVTKKSILEKMKSDVHTIWKYRINGPMSNMPEFSKIFKCDRNEKMNRHKKCLVW